MAPEKLPVSVFIIAKDEADRIPRAIASVRDWVEEVIVIDSGSSDATVAVSEALGARVNFREWTGYGEQKVHGESLCRNRWLLNIDADEEITPELAAEIRRLFEAGPEHVAYTLRFYPVFAHQRRAPRWTYQNEVVRLYRRDRASFSDHPVHDSVLVREGSIGHLKGAVLHHTFRSLSHRLEKLNDYSSIQAESLHREGRRPGAVTLLLAFPVAFIKSYLLRRNCLWGMDGFVNSIVYAFHRFVRLAKLRERHAEARQERPS